jgi:hypothetical protein
VNREPKRWSVDFEVQIQGVGAAITSGRMSGS